MSEYQIDEGLSNFDLSFLKMENQKENLVLQKFPYFIQYKFYSEEKRLDIIILSDKQHK